jgi:hypothetical protein
MPPEGYRTCCSRGRALIRVRSTRLWVFLLLEGGARTDLCGGRRLRTPRQRCLMWITISSNKKTATTKRAHLPPLICIIELTVHLES